MRQRNIIIAAIAFVMLGSCGGNKKNSRAESDSVLQPIAEMTDSVLPKSIYYLTHDSIGSIHVGMSVNEVPDSVAGFYTSKEDGASEDAVTITFKEGERENFIAYDFGEGKIDVINLIGSNVKVKAPRGDFGLGDKFSKVLELPGVAQEWSGYDGNGSWYWVWEGLWFAPSQETLSESLSRRLYHSESAPTVADFSEDVTIGFIGTGLPF